MYQIFHHPYVVNEIVSVIALHFFDVFLKNIVYFGVFRVSYKYEKHQLNSSTKETKQLLMYNACTMYMSNHLFFSREMI